MVKDWKEKIFIETCKVVEDKIKTANDAIEAAEKSQSEDTKSSAGDKVETSREMLKQDIERNQRLLMEAQQQLHVLQSIRLNEKPQIAMGSLIKTSKGYFFMSVPIGKINVEQKEVFVISVTSPVGKMLVGKKLGEEVVFNGVSYKIENIY